jgi:CDP-diacylglycerol--glycerol-3-phosphate 3-phosphatidyltransferase
MKVLTVLEKPPPPRLRWQWVLITLLTTSGLLAFAWLLQTSWQPNYAWRWLGFAIPSTLYLLWWVWRALPDNHRRGEVQLLPSLGTGNTLTILRGVLISALVGFCIATRPTGWLAWIPGCLYTLAVLADLLDGYLARQKGQSTLLGENLDLKLDGFGMLVAALVAVRTNQVPTWYLMVGMARYFYLAGLWLWQRTGRPVYELDENSSRRPLAGAQMGFLGVVLFPIFAPPATHLVAALFALPFLIGFVRDWLVVTGILKPSSHQTGTSWLTQANYLSTRFATLGLLKVVWFSRVPLVLRFFTVGLIASQLFSGSALQLFESSPQGGFLQALSGPFGLGWLLLAAGMSLIALGAAGRLAALGVLVAIGLQQSLTGLSLTQIILITGATALFFLGTGDLSLWKPEEQLIYKRLGET